MIIQMDLIDESTIVLNDSLQHEEDREATSSSLNGHGWDDATSATTQEADQGEEEGKRQWNQKGRGEKEQGDKENRTLDKNHFAPLVVTSLRLQ